MKITTVEQGSPEWKAARLGLPTASNFDRVITPGGKPTKGTTRDKYLARLCCEWFLGVSLDEVQSQFMERGSAMEQQAVAWYEFEHGVEARAVGLCLLDDGSAGASPDRLVGNDGLLEIKCPGAETHMTYLLGGLTTEYRVQTQGQLWIAERAWVDLLAFHPTLPRVCVRLYRDEQFIEAMASAVREFTDELAAAKLSLATEKAEYDRNREVAEMDAQASL